MVPRYLQKLARVVGVFVLLIASLPVAPVSAQPVSGLSLVWPVPASARSQISQGFAQYGSGSATKFHAALDIAGSLGSNVVAAAGGTARVILLSSPAWQNKTKCMGNVVIINHGVVSTLYAHLNSVSISDGATVSQGQAIGTLGRSVGYTANGLDCVSSQSGTNGPSGFEHLHFELKLKAVLGSDNDLGPPNIWGYTPASGTSSPALSDEPTSFGYRNPVLNLHAGISAQVQNMAVTATGGGVSLRHGPGTDYASLGQTTVAGQQFLSVNIFNTATSGCSSGWVQVRRADGLFFADSNGGSNPAAWVCMGNAGETWVASTTPSHLVTVTRAGAGSGTVTSSPAGISCGADCSESYAAGTSVTLSATPQSGSTFSGWSGGGCAGSGTCSLSVSAPVTITATFLANPVVHVLSVSKSGSGAGSISSSPAGISCGANCSESYAAGTQVTLTATPDAGSTFTGWSGSGCSGTSTCVVTLDSAKSVSASFAQVIQHTMLIGTTGSGSGTITSSPGGSCTSPCTGARTYSINEGTSVTVTASAQAGSTFLGWSGSYGSAQPCAGNASSCTFAITTSSGVNAVFIPASVTLSVVKSGNGGGSITSSLGGISCGGSCSGTVPTAQNITLTANPNPGSALVGWSGVTCSGGNSASACSFLLYSNTSVTATFTSLQSSSSALHDLNDDGRSDIIWRNAVTGANWYWSMSGTTIDAQGPIVTLPADWQIQSSAMDFDGDGRADLLLRNMATGQPWVWFMEGNAILGGGPLPTLSDMNWIIAGTGDLNGDGKGDVIWRNTSTGQNWWWALNGTTIISQGAITALPPDWQIQSTLGDFNGDGRTDILWRNMSTGQPWVWMMNGTNITNNSPLPLLSDLNWVIAGTGDLDGNGKSDVVWRHLVSGQFWWWGLNGANINSQGAIAVLPADWKIQSTSADFNADGKTDILLRNTITGQPWIWFMNGNTINSGGPLPTLSDINWQIRVSK